MEDCFTEPVQSEREVFAGTTVLTLALFPTALARESLFHRALGHKTAVIARERSDHGDLPLFFSLP